MPHSAGGAAPPRRRWLALLALSAVLTGLLELARLPAGLLLGPMLAGIVVATAGEHPLRVPNPAFTAAQALIGCLIAASLTPGILATVAAQWPLFVGVTASTILVSAALGYALARWQVLPGTVAVWGSSPGAASAMVIMAQAYGADARLVAVMAYTRVVAVSLVASALSFAFAGPGRGMAAEPAVFAAFDPTWLTGGLLVAGVGAVLGRLMRLPAGGLVGPMLVGAAVNVSGLLDPHPPQLLLGLAYAVVGWRIGLNFTRETVAAAARALPRILLAMLLLIAFCGGLALVLVRFAGIEPVTAYLATSPGGMDSVAIIAANSNVDRPFVMALQALRFFAVLALGPALARFVATRHVAREGRRSSVSPPPP